MKRPRKHFLTLTKPLGLTVFSWGTACWLLLTACGQASPLTPALVAVFTETASVTLAPSPTFLPTLTSTPPETSPENLDSPEIALEGALSAARAQNLFLLRNRWVTVDMALAVQVFENVQEGGGYAVVGPLVGFLSPNLQTWEVLYQGAFRYDPNIPIPADSVEFLVRLDYEDQAFDCYFVYLVDPAHTGDYWRVGYLDGPPTCEDAFLLLTPEPTVTNTPLVTPTSEFNPFATPTPWAPCSDTYPTRLWVGGFAFVSLDPPVANRVRSGPGRTFETIGYIQPGSPMEILAGPECADGWIWWQVRALETGLEGWTAEGDAEGYWLVPCPPEGECGVLPENPS